MEGGRKNRFNDELFDKLTHSRFEFSYRIIIMSFFVLRIIFCGLFDPLFF